MKLSQNFCMPIILMALVLSSVSCGTQTALDSSWDIPPAPDATFRKLVVMAALRSPDRSRTFESSVARELAAGGVNAIPGFAVTGMDPDLPREELEKRVKDRGADGVLIFKMIAVDKTHTYVRPPTYAVSGTRYPAWWSDPYWGYYHPYPHHYWGYWYTATQVVWTPGYWERNITYRVETTLYQVSDNKLVWSATSSTYDPQGEVDLATSLSKAILKRLRKDGFLAPK